MGGERVDLLGPVRILHEHLTAALCETVFDARRLTERRRLWTLHRMAEFWTAVILRAPESLTQALEEAHRGIGGFPRVEATPQAFFERAQGLRSEFFRDLLDAFTERAVRDHRPSFETKLRTSLAAFSSVWVVDGSGLDAIAHRLKVLWDERVVVLPGSVLAFYDVFLGLPRRMRFYDEAMGGEVPRLEAELSSIPKDTLLVGDRLYCSMRLFGGLAEHGLFAVIRKMRSIRVERREILSREQRGDTRIDDVLVLAGTGQSAQQQTLRLIRRVQGRKRIELLTNVLDPELLPAETALALYKRRWTVERMFYDLKVVLNLHRIYAANANAVAMQVYAATLVYVAMRIAQGQLADDAGLRPERISTTKLFPRVAAASHTLVAGRIGYLATCAANPRVRLREPEWDSMEFASAPLASILVEPRAGPRRRRRYCLARRRHASLHHFTRRRRR
jgi:hypothetical protein